MILMMMMAMMMDCIMIATFFSSKYKGDIFYHSFQKVLLWHASQRIQTKIVKIMTGSTCLSTVETHFTIFVYDGFSVTWRQAQKWLHNQI